MVKDVVSSRKNAKDKKSHLLLDVMLEDKDLFPTDDMVCFVFLFCHYLASEGSF